MKKIYMLSLVAMMFLTVSHINAQSSEMIKGGSFKTSDMSAWTIGVNSKGQPTDVVFGNTVDLPTGSKNTTSVKLTHGGAGTPEIQMYQRVKLLGGVTYKVSAKLRIKGDMGGRACQIYIAKDAEPDNGTCFSDAIMNTGDRSKALALFLEGWPFAMSSFDIDINGEFPISLDGTNTDKITPEEDGTYYVLFKVGQWGPTDGFTATVSDLSLTSDLTAARNLVNSAIQIYTSAQNKLIIKGAGNQAKIEVYDLLGKKLVQNKNISGESIDISNFRTGIYIAKVNDGGSISTQKFIKR
jgi:hypothetical protein